MNSQIKLKVLHLPFNVASSASITVSELNKDGSIEAKGIVFGEKHKYTSTENLRYYTIKGGSFGIHAVYTLLILFKHFLWADIIHWYWGSILPYHLDLKLLKVFNKPVFIQWHGSDIRIPEVAMKGNPFYKHVYENGTYEYRNIENKNQSIERQQSFSDIHAIPIVYPELSLNIQKDLFKRVILLRHRIRLESITPNYPNKEKKIPFIVHVSSKEYAKGTDQLIIILEELSKKNSFEYKIITNQSREDVLKFVSECDIFLDQFIIGEYGLAAVEAMAMGKPVVSYIRPEIQNLMPDDFPIVNTALNNLSETIKNLIDDAQLRNILGHKSREYVESYHDSKKVISTLIQEYYQELKN